MSFNGENVLIESYMNAYKYVHILQDKFVYCALKLGFCDSWYFQYDNDWKHKITEQNYNSYIT